MYQKKMNLAIPKPPLVANRRPRNLKELLTKATLKSPQRHQGSHRCGRPRSKMCANVKMGTSFKSTVTNLRFRARVDVTCKTSCGLIECVRCYKQYVAETENPLYLRINGHQSEYYRKLPDKPFAVHFNTVGHTFENLTVMIIDQLGSAPTERRKVRESY